MQQTYYTLSYIPDLSLNKYTTLDESGVDGVLHAHGAFWRQMHRRGILGKDAFHLFYEYDPQRPAGRRLQIGLRFDTEQPQDETFVEQTIRSSSISPFYELKRVVPGMDETGVHLERTYAFQAHLIKKESFRRPLRRQDAAVFYTASEWEMNEKGLLFTMMRLMAAINRPCLYCVSVYPQDMAEPMTQALENVLPQLRQAVRPQISTHQGAVGLREKDENADATLQYYEDLLEKLAQNPNFLVDIQVMSDDVRHAAYILDAAAAEALEEGAHEIRYFSGALSLSGVGQQNFPGCADARAPAALAQMPQLFVLNELIPFAVLPALYPGEVIDLPKESAPPARGDGLLLGDDNEGHAVYFPLKNLSKHAFLAGVPGSGKTNSMMHLIAEMHIRYHIPVLIMEPAKHEYRALTGVQGMEDLELFSPGASTRFPLHINPFEFPCGMTLAEHIRNLIAVFDGAFALEPPMPFLLDASVEEVYADHNWVPAMRNRGQLSYPTMSELYKKLEEKLEKTDYAPEIQGNLKSALQVRIGSLLTREMGDIFDVPYSSVPAQEWIRRSAVIELEAMGKDQANFATLLIATLIRETLKVENYQPEPDGRPRHVIFFEEAHNLIGPTAEPKSRDEADPKTAATAYIVRMLAEVRALGEGIVIADQLPTAMAPEVIKNTSLKIALRITAQDDRELLGGTMNANPDQLESLSVFSPGHALISYEPLLKPFEAQLPHFVEAKEGKQEDAVILENVLENDTYWTNILRSLDISTEKWNDRRRSLEKAEKAAKEKLEKMRQLAGRVEQENDQATVEQRAKMYDLRREFYEVWDPLMKDAAALAVAVASYKSPFDFLFASQRAKSMPQVQRFKKQLMEQLVSAVRYQRKITSEFREQGIPIAESWLERYVQRKDLLLQQTEKFDNL